MNLYQLDANQIATGKTAAITDPRQPVPARWVATDTAPPCAISQWGGDKWIELKEYPVPPPQPERVPTYSKIKIVEVLDGMGRLQDFAGMLSQAPLRVQMRWAAAGELEGGDDDLRAIVGMIAEAWKLTPEQVAEILKQCEA